MSNDIIVKIHRATRTATMENNVIGNDSENLQGNIVFRFVDSYVEGQARLEYRNGLEKNYVVLLKKDEEYYCPITAAIAKNGKTDMQLVISQGTEEENVPVFKSNVFSVICNVSINAEIEKPDELDGWMDVANSKLNQMDNIDVSASKEGETAKIEVTNKEGSKNEVEVKDGITPTIGSNGNWFLGTIDTGKPSRGETGDKGDAGSVRFVIVNELPTANIDLSAIYLKPSNNPAEQNKYGEYIYVNGTWESLSSTSIEVNLDEYVKKTDYASTNKAGVIKVSTSMGLKMNEDGSLYYLNANAAETQAKETTKRVLTPKYVDYIIKYGLTDNQLDWTDEDKQKARALLGVDEAIANSVTEVLGGSF